MHDPRLVDAADADVLEDLLVDLPHLRWLRDEILAIEGRHQQGVELGCLRLHRGIGIEPEEHQRAGLIPDIGQIGKTFIVGDPELVEHRFPDDRIQDLDDPGSVVSGGFGSFDQMGDNACLGCHRCVERGIQCPRDIGQRDLAHIGEDSRNQLGQMHGRDFSFVAQGRRGIVKQGRRGRQDRDRQQSRQGDKHTGCQAQAFHRYRL